MGFFSKKKKPTPLMTVEEAADYLRISKSTLKKAEKTGALRPFKTPGGHRRYSIKILNEYLESTKEER